jgi:arsenite methyltransferase
MKQETQEIHEVVRRHYADRITQQAGCCGGNGSTGQGNLYPAELLDTLAPGEAPISYGCGDPISLAGLQPGQTVLDLGSGAGLDCFLAARKVGDTGHVIGVDMTPEMLERARASASRMGLPNVEFRQGLLEELPVDDESMDVVISNCVINLAPDKAKVMAEVQRVLRPGGQVAVSDIVTDGPLPQEIKNSLSAWAGCIAGAISAEEYRAVMEGSGLVSIEITPTYFDEEMIDEAIDDVGEGLDLTTWPRQTIAKSVFSARITARKPSV